MLSKRGEKYLIFMSILINLLTRLKYFSIKTIRERNYLFNRLLFNSYLSIEN